MRKYDYSQLYLYDAPILAQPYVEGLIGNETAVA